MKRVGRRTLVRRVRPECFTAHLVQCHSRLSKQRNQLRSSNDVNDRIACILTRFSSAATGQWQTNAPHHVPHTVPNLWECLHPSLR